MRSRVLNKTTEDQLSVLRADLLRGEGSLEAQVTQLLR